MPDGRSACSQCKAKPLKEGDVSCAAGSELFVGVDQESLTAMLGCINAYVRCYKHGEAVLKSGCTTTKMGLVLEGSVRIERIDYWGNRTLLGACHKGDCFAEVYASTPDLMVDIDVVTDGNARVLVMDVGRVTTMCPNSCVFHTQLIRNLLGSVSGHTHGLMRKIDYLSKRTTRLKLLSYLSDCAVKEGSSDFEIRFNRQELADFLAVDRSAMSAELSRMKREGLIDYKKNRFVLKEACGRL